MNTKTLLIVLVVVIIVLGVAVGFLIFNFTKTPTPAVINELNQNLNIVNLNAAAKTSEELSAIAKTEAAKLTEADYWANQLGVGVVEGKNNCSLTAQSVNNLDENKKKNYDNNLATCKAIRQNDYKLCDSIDATVDVPDEFKSASASENSRFSKRFQCQFTFFAVKLKDLLFNNKISDCGTGLNDCYNIQSGLSKDDTTKYCNFSCHMLMEKKTSACDEISYLHYQCLAFVKDDIKVCEQLSVAGLAASDTDYKNRVILDCKNGFYLYKYLGTKDSKYLDAITLGFDEQMFGSKFQNFSCEDLALNPIKIECDSFYDNLQKAMQNIDCNSFISPEFKQKCETYKNVKG